ncbi:hypothetical protein PR048_015907 [Dryococelus australis]|uniref:Uncharacterized protein n=1 Tax=Dryococelus australis TaxID=614101 RepID=A0ABQ9HIL4_9NEOP|nr:hypothetical protein PR048_015907 [Dryococelus australis]
MLPLLNLLRTADGSTASERDPSKEFFSRYLYLPKISSLHTLDLGVILEITVNTFVLGLRQCPVYGGKCGIMNHFAVLCRVRKVREVNVNHSSSESLYCDAVTVMFIREELKQIMLMSGGNIF